MLKKKINRISRRRNIGFKRKCYLIEIMRYQYKKKKKNTILFRNSTGNVKEKKKKPVDVPFWYRLGGVVYSGRDNR